MNREAMELHTRLVQLREREAELQRKLLETRDLLAKADARRAREPAQVGRWNAILDNLENSYDAVRRDLERTRTAREEVEHEFERALDSSGATLESLEAAMEAVPVTAPIPSVVPAPVTTPDPAPDEDISAFEEDYSSPADVNEIGWRDLLHMSLDDLSQLTEAEIAAARERFKGSISSRISETDRRLLDSRLLLATQLRSDAQNPAANPKERLHRRWQIILRAAIDKIQQNRTAELTQEEAMAVQLCQQRLKKVTEPSTGEKRLLRLMEGALGILRRQQRKLS